MFLKNLSPLAKPQKVRKIYFLYKNFKKKNEINLDLKSINWIWN